MTIHIENIDRLRELAKAHPFQALEIGLTLDLIHPAIRELLEWTEFSAKQVYALEVSHLFPPQRGYTREKRKELRTLRLWLAAAMLERRGVEKRVHPYGGAYLDDLRAGVRLSRSTEALLLYAFTRWPNLVPYRSASHLRRREVHSAWKMLLHERSGREACSFDERACLTKEFLRCAAWQLTRDQPMDLGVRI